MRFKPQDAETATQWGEILAGERADDLIVIRQKGGLDFQAGVLGDVNNATADFKLDDETLSIKHSGSRG